MNRPILFALFLCLGVSELVIGCGGGDGSNNGGNGGNGGSGGNTPTVTTPTVASISPTSVPAGSTALTLTVNGTNFDNTTTIQVGGVPDVTKYVSATQLTATVEPSQMVMGGEYVVIAVKAGVTSGASPAVKLEVTNPAPAITVVDPETVTTGADSPLIAVAGTGFVPTTVINVNGSARTTFYTSATQVGVLLTAADIASSGNLSLTAVNPSPGGGTSTAATVSVVNPVPVIATLSPSTVLTTATTPAVITVNGTNFIPSSTVQLNGLDRATTYVSATQITFQLTAADLAISQRAYINVVNPKPGGGASYSQPLNILNPLPAPAILDVTPSQFVVGSGATSIVVTGTNMAEQMQSGAISLVGSVAWNGTPLQTLTWTYSYSYPDLSQAQVTIYASVPAELLSSKGTASVTLVSSASTPAESNAAQVTITDPPAPTLITLQPTTGPVHTATSVTLTGTGFQSASTVAVNGVTVPSKFINSTQLTATIPADSVALPGNASVTVTTPAPGGGTSSALTYTAYVAVPANDIVYNPSDRLIYASVPGSAGSGIGNSVVGIDPVTGNVTRTIWVGSEPNKLALSTDGTQLFVGADGANSVKQINLVSGRVVRTISLGGTAAYNDSTRTATFLAAVPGRPGSVAVLASNGIITIYDSGVARVNDSNSLGLYLSYNNSIVFDSTGTKLYANGYDLEALAVDASGITARTSIYPNSSYGIMQYDNGRIYLPNGVVVDASNGSLAGTFYVNADSAAQGPIVSDSTLNRAFIASQNITSNGNVILAFDEGTFNPAGSIVYKASSNYYNITSNRLIRWGQNGLAFNAQQVLYIFQSPVVKDNSSSPADLSITLSAPETATTGSSISYVATVKNLGPNEATGVAAALNLDASLIVSSVSASQGSCGTGPSFTCSLGTLTKDATATVTITAKPTVAGSLAASALVDSVSYDSEAANNQVTASTTVTGDQYSAVPLITSLSPNMVQAGADTFALTVTGNGFNPGSIVNLNGAALATTYVSPTELAAEVAPEAIAQYGWAPVTVTNPSPGGGTSSVSPLTIYAVVDVPANSMLLDPFSQQLYATVPSASTTVTGNSIVGIDPVTGTVGTPVLIGSEPDAVTETSSGKYIYVALTGSNSLAQFDVLQHKLTATIPITATSNGSTTDVKATWLAAVPGSDNSVAAQIANGWNNFGIFDISGNTGSFRPNFSGYYVGNNPAFTNATDVYAASGSSLYRYTVNANGVTLLDSWSMRGLSGSNSSFNVAPNGILYGGGGGIIDPYTTPPTQIASLPFPNISQSNTSSLSGLGIAPDISTHKNFLMLSGVIPSTQSYGIVRYDTDTYLPDAILNLPSSLYYNVSSWQMLRWGQDGLALLPTPYSGSSQTVPSIILLRGPFVTPQLLVHNSSATATLTSSSTTTIVHGSGNVLLTLTGSNFAPGMAVTWNGSYRTTTIVDATHVTVAIPASDLKTTGSGSLVATNPGASASNALTVTIN